jgi:hypothetical protein
MPKCRCTPGAVALQGTRTAYDRLLGNTIASTMDNHASHFNAACTSRVSSSSYTVEHRCIFVCDPTHVLQTSMWPEVYPFSMLLKCLVLRFINTCS